MKTFLACLVLLLAPGLMAGCNILGVAAAKLGPPPTIPAQYRLKQEQTVVLVENFHNPASLRLESDAITPQLVEEMTMHKVAPIVETSKIEKLRQTKGAAYRSMPLDEIAKEFGATQVVYVDLEKFGITQALASDMLGGEAEARVRVVDDKGEVLWPLDSARGYPVNVKIEPKRVPPSGTGQQTVRQELHATLADRVAKLFYAWQVNSIDGGAEKFGQ